MDIAALEMATLLGDVHQNSSQVERLVDRLGKCLDEARALADLDAPYSEDVMQSLWTASDTIETLVKQLEGISGVAMVASNQSLNRMGKKIQSYVAGSALVNVGTGNRAN